MYLARHYHKGRTFYSICESLRIDDRMTSRKLVDLGEDPTLFIRYPGGNAFYFEPAIVDGLEAMGVSPDDRELENVFWPFIDPAIRRVIEPFQRRSDAARKRTAPGLSELDAEQFHLFDRRRLLFLKTGQMDQSRLRAVPGKIFRILVDKSRDEIEQTVMEQERVLRPREIKPYVFVIFNLQRHFHKAFARNHPELLDQEQIESCFEQELCRLNADQDFWFDAAPKDPLDEYLVRYACMFFDNDFTAHQMEAEYLRQFYNRHRTYRPPQSVVVKMEEAAGIFGQSIAVLKKMSRRELAKLYRRKAMEFHPDQGGDHDQFVKLTNAYHGLMRTKH